ncbi:hypothetical protein T01_6549 [Trichinella spiralis]|uniref:Uncharacterized protein n=1 Tax=Trichinella spiralis TaxID=6334 RepID=A0A0V1BWK3_TRISP|nr:hypothetical protein T01_6549 [Trichinella spiralis]
MAMLHTDLFAAEHLSFLGRCCCQLMAYEDRLLCAARKQNCSEIAQKLNALVFLFCNWDIDAAAVAQLSVGRMISKSTTAIQKVRGIMI